MIGLDRSLCHVGERGIGSAKSDDGKLGEEDHDLARDMIASKQLGDEKERADPDGKPERRGLKRVRQRH